MTFNLKRGSGWSIKGQRSGDKWGNILHMFDCKDGVGGWRITSEIVKEIFSHFAKNYLPREPTRFECKILGLLRVLGQKVDSWGSRDPDLKLLSSLPNLCEDALGHTPHSLQWVPFGKPRAITHPTTVVHPEKEV